MSQRTPIWPYVLVLGCLFALALIAPRGWDRFAADDGAQPTAASQAAALSDRPAGSGAALVVPAQVQPARFLAPADADAALPKPVKPSENAADQADDQWQSDAAAELTRGGDKPQEPILLTIKSTGPSATGPLTTQLAASATTPSPSADATGPVVEIASPAVLELHRDVTSVGQSLASELSRTLRAFAIHPKLKAPPPEAAPAVLPFSEPEKLPTAALPSPSPSDKPAVGHAVASDSPTGSKTPPAISKSPAASDAADATPAPRAWPLPQSLLDALHAISGQDAAVRDWASDVEGQIEHLNQLRPQDVHQAAAVLKQLRHAVEQAAALAAQATNQEAASDIRRVQYAMVRRLDVWEIVCDERQTTIANNTQVSQNRHRMELCLADVNALDEQNGGATGLREHLMLDTLAQLAKRDDEANADERRHVAREVLNRIAERRQAAGRPPLIEERSLAALDKQLQQWVAPPAEGVELLALVERYESNGRAEDARHLAELRDQLGRSTVAADNDLGRRIDVHYRNANVRVALNSQLINRLLPEQKTVESPVDDTILGTPVRGRSTTSTELAVRLLPDPRTWQVALEAAGNVESRTSSTYGPVTFLNQGAAQFCVRKRIVVDTAGIHAEPAAAAVDSNTAVADMRTDYDNIPLVRSIVRNYAMSQRQQKEGQANQETEEKIRAAACSRVDSQVEPRLAQVEQNFRDRVLEPLKKLDLNPAVATLETTDTRLTVRSRLAGTDQLAAHTPRPDAPADSLASLQLHESAVNNLLDHLDLAGRTLTLPELLRHLNEKLSRAAKPLPQDLPEGVDVTFAKDAPMRVRCTGGRIELMLNIAEIRQGKRRWHDFEVRASYRPEMHGLAADFQRDGSIELGGLYKGKTEVALRGIFSKVLSRERKISLLPSLVTDDPRLADLQVTQLVVEDGWIGVAIGPKAASARRQTHSVKRL